MKEIVGDTFAAVDLGSNSFHMVIARGDGTELSIVDRLREMVRLAAGLDEDRRITPDAIDRAQSCLERFGQRLREVPAENVRVVGTSTLRQARNADAFITQAEAALGHRIEVISGMEEARLIYLGVAHSLAGDGRRLVIDIGGGSTELIVGEGFEALRRSSLHVGCVGQSHHFFGDGHIGRVAFERAELDARIEFEPYEQHFRSLDWQHAIGASGTIKAVASALDPDGSTAATITAEGLDDLRSRMIDAGHVDRLNLPGVRRERNPVFPGGVAILRAAFAALDITEMRVSTGALREGLLYDLPGRLRHDDIRGASVDSLARRFHIDDGHAKRVQRSALGLFQQVRQSWSLEPEDAWMLRWAATLHEIGRDIAHSAYHKHGAYIVANSDLAGFGREEQEALGLLVRAHRKRFPKEVFAALPKREGQRLARLAVLLRVAVRLHRGRSEWEPPVPAATASGRKLRLDFPAGWLAAHPLTQADLNEEAELLKAGGFRLRLQDEGGS